MKTPLQELIEEMQSARRMCDDPSMEMDIWTTLDVLISKAELMLEKEKEVIITSHINGQSEFDKGARRDLNDKYAESYYNEKFNNK